MTPTAAMQPGYSTLASERSVDRWPHCILVTGTLGAGTTLWVDECVGRLMERNPGNRCGVLLADQSPVRKDTACADKPGVVVRGCFLPCTCCPSAADLLAAVHGLVQANQPNWIFIEIPVIAAPGLIAEFDRMVRWPRSLVVGLTPAWVRPAAWDHCHPLGCFCSKQPMRPLRTTKRRRRPWRECCRPGTSRAISRGAGPAMPGCRVVSARSAIAAKLK